ncbi:MAG: hypothetical protein KIS66_14665 [Fimbriimonadaceae bacterium]|nr:hypothetical protein [Fimbriimonadaceae bacterium]
MPNIAILASLALALAPAGAGANAFSVKPVKTMVGLKAVNLVPAPAGSRVAVALESPVVRIIDANTRATLSEFKEHKQTAMAVAWTHDGKWVASGDEGARIYVWDPKTGKRRQLLPPGHQRGIHALSFNDKGDRLISTGKDDTIRVWNLATNKETGMIPGKGVNFYGAMFVPKTNTILVATIGQGPQLYDANGKLLASFGGHNGQGCLDVALGSNGRVVSAGRDNLAQVWDLKSRKRIGNLKGHGDMVIWAAVAPSGRVAATGSVDGTVKVWDTVNCKELAALPQQSFVGSPVCFTADGKYLVTLDQYDYVQVNGLTPGK